MQTENIEKSDTTLSRQQAEQLLDEAIQEAHRKATDGRVYDAENERVRQGWVKALGYLVGQKRQLKRDKELEEMKADIEMLKEQRGGY
jgi:hypothetical protein